MSVLPLLPNRGWLAVHDVSYPPVGGGNAIPKFECWASWVCVVVVARGLLLEVLRHAATTWQSRQTAPILEVSVMLELIQLHIAILIISLSIVTINNISLCLTLLFPFILSNLVIDSLQNCKDTLAMCHASFITIDLISEFSRINLRLLNLRFKVGIRQFKMSLVYLLVPLLVKPKMLRDYLQALKSSEESLREQLEKAKKKEAAFIVTFAKREQEIAKLKVSCSK
ncbi:hypothetical protein Ahy_A09g044484 [Arachis hypogaea]|uniref:Uncharacterized protein n=1 Tax=Arachis hypogaea TaxID=3818 RepID=A0A445BK51_ARAHY|nr:hypothetical protein Ahy_A09g044484 [Arachis hypogaea]